MLLRIIDQPSHQNTKIRVVIEAGCESEDFLIESYNSPIGRGFTETLTWYFKDYLQHFEDNTTDRGIGEKIIKFGQYIGDELLGEDHQLIKLKNRMEAIGYENINVQIESARVEFFKEWWEICILFESQYVLSTVTGSYVRRFLLESNRANFPELNYQLKVKHELQDNLKTFSPFGMEPEKNESQSEYQPLQSLYILSRPKTLNVALKSSNIISRSLATLASGGAINYELHQYITWEKLQSLFTNINRQLHVVHYDGPVVIENGEPHIVLENNENNDATKTSILVSVSEFSRALATNKIGCLFLDANTYLENDTSVSAAEGLALVALHSHQQGVGNIIGLTHITDPWTSGNCFDVVYNEITKGHSLEQAIVEARKTLQTNIENSLLTTQPIPFHSWPLLSHYSLQSVRFFSAPVIEDTDKAKNITQNKLFGFKSNLLPPLLQHVGDSQLVRVIEQLINPTNFNKTVSILGKTGSGKSQAAHLISLYLVQKHIIDFGFYFSFTKDLYTSKDILEMISPVLKLSDSDYNTNIEEVRKKLPSLKCCFVLDDISTEVLNKNPSDKNSIELVNNLYDFLIEIAAQGHVIILVGDLPAELNNLANQKIEIMPLEIIEQKIIAIDLIHQTDMIGTTETRIHWLSFLGAMNGNPWLIKKTVPLIKSSSMSDLASQIQELHKNTLNKSIKVCFYQWQWNNLKPIWQRWLSLLAGTPGLLIEMVALAADQKSFRPAEALFELLGGHNEKFSDGLDLLESSGFLSRYPHGRLIDTDCLDFLLTLKTACFVGIDDEQCNVYFSQIVCEGVRVLAEHLIKNPNPSISNNLLINRRQWAKHLEILWFEGDYRNFARTKANFDHLLHQAKLESESHIWTLDLLARSPIPEINLNQDYQLYWLAMASSAVNQSITEKSATEISSQIISGAAIWRRWLDEQQTINKEQLILFVQVSTFLETYYRRHLMWRDAIVVCEKTYTVLESYNAWHKVIQLFGSIAIYYFKLGCPDKALSYENKIINDIPFPDAQPGFKTQWMLDILQLRLARSDFGNARLLLEKLRNSDDAERLKDALNSLDLTLCKQEKMADMPPNIMHA